MLTLHVEAETFPELCFKAARMLNANVVDASGVKVPPTAPVAEVSQAVVDEMSKDLPREAQVEPPQPASEVSEPGRRGRRRGQRNVETAQPEVAQNTGSDQASESPAAGGAETVGQEPENPGSAAVEVTLDAFKGSLMKITDKFPGDDGLTKVTKLLNDAGYTGANAKIKMVKPEHYAGIMAAADKLLTA